MSYLYAGKPSSVSSEDWVQGLAEATWGTYQILLLVFKILSHIVITGYLYVNNFKVRIGVLYALYLLYGCQPYKPPRKIRISLGTVSANGAHLTF